MVRQQFLDPGREEFSLVEYCLEWVGEAGKVQCCRVGARDDVGLSAQGGEDVADGTLGHRGAFGGIKVTSRRRPAFVYLGGRAELGEELKAGRAGCCT
ncbi:hypothetical protein [Streptomyces sp. NPDC088748]|uniref:hypothetical protein n=1 Tax=Streptomyces sp. NPDC088748 TaxID=3365887 RepID=UPI00380338F8